MIWTLLEYFVFGTLLYILQGLCVSNCHPNSASISYSFSSSAEIVSLVPTLKILEYVRDKNRQTFNSHPRTFVPSLHSDLIIGKYVGKSSKVALQCVALYPVEWCYNGDGEPNFSICTSNKTINYSYGMVEYSATLTFDYERNLKAEDTGNYTCLSKKHAVSDSIHIYVPDEKKLFVSSGQKKIYFSYNQTSLRVPCSTTNPDTVVSLHKLYNGKLRCPVNENMSFNTKTGFHLNKLSTNPAAIYVCTASSHTNNSIQLIEFTVVNEGGSSYIDIKEDSNESTETGNDYRNPCKSKPSPCGVNAICRVINGDAVCRCREGFIGNPYENCDWAFKADVSDEDLQNCTFTFECQSNETCTMGKCVSACIGQCNNMECIAENHVAKCIPYNSSEVIDLEEDKNITADWQTQFSRRSVLYRAPEKLISRCSPKLCGSNAECIIVNYQPHCVCEIGFDGNGKEGCVKSFNYQKKTCLPSPCGNFATCLEIGDGYIICSCLENITIGEPPNCRLPGQADGCKSDNECPIDKACHNGKCEDPCETTETFCASNAKCKVVNHVVKCHCELRETGNPYVKCFPISNSQIITNQRPIIPQQQQIQQTVSADLVINPCHPSPCGISSLCRVIHGNGNGSPVCYCPRGFVGNALVECRKTNQDVSFVSRPSFFNMKTTPRPIPLRLPLQNHPKVPPTVCKLDTCGRNAYCKEVNGFAVCRCIHFTTGDPYESCEYSSTINGRPTVSESVDSLHTLHNNEMPLCPKGIPTHFLRNCRPQESVDSKCSKCGLNSKCIMTAYDVQCLCDDFSTGYFPNCRRIINNPLVASNPCLRTYCGKSSVCRIINGNAQCTCDDNYGGTYPNCYMMECRQDSDCSEKNNICENNKCVNPCSKNGESYCGQYALCEIVDRIPICLCGVGTTGDAYEKCVQIEYEEERDPCLRCGLNSLCQISNGHVNCQCSSDAHGVPPYCTKGVCWHNQQCASHETCQNLRCKNPCTITGTCGTNAICQTLNHVAQCSCPSCSSGNPQIKCHVLSNSRCKNSRF